MCRAAAILIAIVFGLAGTSAAHYSARSATEIASVLERLRPGDEVILADGVWTDQAITFKGRGTAEKPIRLRAFTPGGVRLSGRSSLVVDGSHLEIAGLRFEAGGGGGDAIRIQGEHCRLTETAVIGGDYKFFVHLFGIEHQVERCYLAGKTNDSPTLQIEVGPTPNRHRLAGNYFGPRPPLRRNGGETIRVGYSHQSMLESGTIVEDNLFEECDGEIEIISSKSCGNIYRHNTFLNCAGMLTLRHGNRCRVEGNFFLGRGKRGSGGIRVIGEDHVVINNYIEGVTQGGIWLTSGAVNPPLVGYVEANRCLVAFNSILHSRGPCVELDAGLGSSQRTLRPSGVVIANNFFAPLEGGTVFKGKAGEDFRWLGNVVSATNVAADGNWPGMAGVEGVRRESVTLARSSDGLLRPNPDGPWRGAAAGNWPDIRTDMDGQLRFGKLDCGADQVSDEAVLKRPLNRGEVGPAWMRPTALVTPPASQK